MDTNKRTLAELSEAFTHINYEYQMLIGTYIIISHYTLDFSNAPVDEFIKQSIPQICKNTVIESFTIHARSLIDFFNNKSFKPDDVLLCDFVHNYDSYKIFNTNDNSEIKVLYNRIDKEIAHLTYKRTNEADLKTWNFEYIISTIRPRYDEFIAEISQNPNIYSKSKETIANNKKLMNLI